MHRWGDAENKIELAKMGIEIILFLKFTEKMLLYHKLNHRPRKVLQYRTPFEVFFAGNQSTVGVALQC